MFVFCTNKSAQRRFGERGGSCHASDPSYNNNGISSIRRAVDVCLIIVYAINLILILLRLIRGNETEPDEIDGESE
jgi:hypothetical protein